MRILSRTLLVLFILFLSTAEFAQAGFGITPPYVRNTSLTRNSIYEQQILLVRSDPKRELIAEVSIDAPEIEPWIEIVEGNEIALPAGEQKVPMTVRLVVPDDADFKQYSGKIRIKTTPPDEDIERGVVSIALGAQVDIDLTVIDREIFDFRVRKIGADDLNAGHKVGWLYFPGKIRFDMLIENTGNVDVAPSRVDFSIYDFSGDTLLEETSSLGRMEKVEPFGTGEVTAEIPTRLPPGSYLARYEIYNHDELKQEGELTLTIKPYGTLQAAGFGFVGLSLTHKLSVIIPLLSILFIAIFLGLYLRTLRRNRRQT